MEKITNLDNRYRNIVENTPDIIWETGADMRYIYISPAVTKVTGLLPQELLGTLPSWLSDLHLGEVEGQMLREAPTSLSPPIIRQHTLRHKDGHQVSVETRALPVFSSGGEFKGLLGTDRDITKQKRVEDALIESGEQYRHLVENMSDVIYSVNRDGTVSYVSPNVAELLGYEPSSVIGSGYSHFIHPEDLNNAKSHVACIFDGETETNDYRVVHRTGDVRYVQTRSRPITCDGAVIGLQGVMRDITERKGIEEALHKTDAKLRSITENSPDMILLKGRCTNRSP